MGIQSLDKKQHRLNIVAVFIASFAVWSTVQAKLLIGFGVPVPKALTDAVVSNLLLEALCLLIINNMRYYLPRKEKYWYCLAVSTVLAAFWLLLSWAALWSLFKNDQAYLRSFSGTVVLRYMIAFLMVGCCTALSLLWYSQKDMQAENIRKASMEQLAREAELHKLRQQLQPHFLFNSLNSISALTGSQPEKARHMIQQLSDFLRGSLKKEEQKWSSFEEELQYLQLYLDIEKVRFGYRLQTRIDAAEETLQLQLPAMLLQPLVENAIKFGLYDTIDEICIEITAKKVDQLLEVTVMNPFDQSTAAPLKGTGFGLSSIRRRLYLLFGRADLLETSQEAQKFITKIRIPQLHESNYN